MGTETRSEPTQRTGPARRSDRSRTPDGIRNPWALVALVCALLGLAAAGAIVEATLGFAPFDRLPDRAGYALYGAVPSFGVLGLVIGGVALRRARLRWVSVIAIVIASIEVLVAIGVLVLLLNAGRSL